MKETGDGQPLSRRDPTRTASSRSLRLVVRVVDPKPGDSIIDCCAAPGGKTLFMASCLNGQGSISSVGVNKSRLRILKETAKLHECDQVITTIHADLRAIRADLRWTRKLEDMEELINLPDTLLDSASNLVKPGGVLIYSTCSVDPDENCCFSSETSDKYVSPPFVTEGGFYSSSPVKHSLDGAFAARLIRST
ncbi:probable ribosomal RNA small subunit methyltransferase B [Salvia splendens]|uniref:probable ribosomal RNA small subunit methyltransferase B n=1 Tax=Salvia splendens TaxID=180675 RepID=UPI001C2682D9|nr:probable ribosomal RNA small subunit methyltransferase B [Salvia splendens]